MRSAKKQKFPRGTRVMVSVGNTPGMSHFPTEYYAIVQYTYHQKYGGGDINSYCVVALDTHGRGCNSISWYTEQQLTKIKGHTLQEGLRIMEDYFYPKYMKK